MSGINRFVGRRNFLRLTGLGIVGIAAGCGLLSDAKQTLADIQPEKSKQLTPDEAIRKLLDGNRRFIRQQRQYPDQSMRRLQSVAKAQYPFAAILGCADSRVPAEIIFDQGLGNLFVVRVAGNVASDMAVGSLEYSASVLGSQLILVLGHRRCGAVAEAIKDKQLPGKMGFLVNSIKPAVDRVKLTSGDIQENAVLANIQYQVEKLQTSSNILFKLVGERKLKIAGACYDIDTGKVSIIT
jgi:carbonic anhydrase